MGLKDNALFGDAGRGGDGWASERLEAAVESITLKMLEAVRLSRTRLSTMLEHPRAEEFVVGAYMRYPDLEEAAGRDGSPYALGPGRFLPAQITKVSRAKSSTTNANSNADGLSQSQSQEGLQLSLLQYTQRADGSLKLKKSKVELALVSEEPFTHHELEAWKKLLKLFDGRPGSEKLYALPNILPIKGLKLASFSFTSEDVDEIIRRKRLGDDGAPFSVLKMSLKELYLRKAELENEIEDLKETAGHSTLQNLHAGFRLLAKENEQDDDDDDGLLHDEEARIIADKKEELKRVSERLETLKVQEEASATADNQQSRSHPQHLQNQHQYQKQSSFAVLAGGLPKSVDPTTSMLTPKFLQGNFDSAAGLPTGPAEGSGAGDLWYTLPFVQSVETPSWHTPQSAQLPRETTAPQSPPPAQAQSLTKRLHRLREANEDIVAKQAVAASAAAEVFLSAPRISPLPGLCRTNMPRWPLSDTT